MKFNVTISLIIISVIFTIIYFLNNEFVIFGMNRFYLYQKDFVRVFFQFCFYSFIHGSILHLLSNIIFIYLFGSKVENYLKQKLYIIFFILSTIFIGIAILIFSNSNTIGISGFAMALLSFHTIMLYESEDLEYKGGVTAIVVNILMGFTGNISLVGHLFGAIFGILFVYGYKKYKKYLYF